MGTNRRDATGFSLDYFPNLVTLLQESNLGKISRQNDEEWQVGIC